ncbi:MAG: tetratricopeptide repeat protein [Oligoflexia bacterium]|nr:tetratricopeptide repeat protein [Oligoflexia bacterium]
MKKLNLTFLIFALIASAKIGAQSEGVVQLNAESELRRAESEYRDEAQDYVETISDNIESLRAWRQKLLKERFDRRLTKIEEVLSSSNNDVRKQIEEYVAYNGIESLDDSLMMRMAQLHYERALFDQSNLMKQYEKDMAAFQKGKRKDPPLLPNPKFEKVIYYSAELIRKYPNSPLSDRAHYLLGYCLFDEGKNDKAAKVYERMIKVHPFSEYTVEARWRLAELYFDLGDYAKSVQQYKILADSESSFKLKSIYKLGAVLFNLNKNEESAQIFLTLLKKTKEQTDELNPETVTLKQEALEYLGMLRARGAKFIVDLDTESEITEQLAQFFRRHQDEAGYRSTFQRFISQTPHFSKAPRYISQIIESFENEGQEAKAQEVRNKLIASYAPDSPYWEKNRKDVTAVVEAQDITEEQLLLSAEFYADQARRTKRQIDYNAAIGFYKTFLARYPFSPLIARAHFELAELFYFSGQYAQASSAYRQIIDGVYNDHYRRDAAYGYLLSESKLSSFQLEDNRPLEPARQKDGSLLAAQSLSPSEAAFLQAAQIYINVEERGVRRQKVLYRAAEVFFRRNQFEKARAASQLISEDPQSSLVGFKALRLISTTYNLENNWEKLDESRRLLSSIGSISDDEIDDHLNLMNGSNKELAMAAESETQGDRLDAAQNFEAFFVAHPKAEDADVALFRAAINYRRVGQIAASQRTISRLLTNFGNTAYRARAEFLRSANELTFLDFEAAAKGFESFVRTYPSHELSPQASLMAFQIYSGLNLPQKSGAMLTEFARRTGDPDLYLDVASVYSKSGDLKRANGELDRLAGGKFGPDLTIRAQFAKVLNKPETSSAECQKIGKFIERFKQSATAYRNYVLEGCRYLMTESVAQKIIASKDAPQKPLLDRFELMVTELQKTQVREWQVKTLRLAGRTYLILATQGQDVAMREKGLNTMSEYFRAERRSLLTPEGRKDLELIFQFDKGKFPWARAEFLWPSIKPIQVDPEDLVISWPEYAGAIRSSHDQGLWEEVLTTAKKDLKEVKEPHLYLASAKAAWAMNQSALAREQLETCIKETDDGSCLAALTILGTEKASPKAIREKLKDKIKTESTGLMRVALAWLDYKERKDSEALNWLKSAAKDGVSGELPFLLTAKIHAETKNPDLARLALTEGLRIGESVKRLELRRGYLDLQQDSLDRAKVYLDELRNQQALDGDSKAFAAFTLQALGKPSDALELLAKESGGLSQSKAIVGARFALALSQSDAGATSALLPAVAEFAKTDGYFAYLLAIEKLQKRSEDPDGLKGLAQAEEMGIRAPWKQLRNENLPMGGVRKPTETGEKQ